MTLDSLVCDIVVSFFPAVLVTTLNLIISIAGMGVTDCKSHFYHDICKFMSKRKV